VATTAQTSPHREASSAGGVAIVLWLVLSLNLSIVVVAIVAAAIVVWFGRGKF
jgi:hypothetical protein